MKIMRVICLALALTLASTMLALTTVSAADGVTRAAFLERLAEATELRSRLYGGEFADVTAKDAFADTLEGALAAGIVARSADGRFEPDREITRSEAAAMALAALKHNLAAAEGELFADLSGDGPLTLGEADALLSKIKRLLGELPLTVGDAAVDKMLNYARDNIDAFEAENPELGAKARENLSASLERYINGGENDAERAAELAALAYGAMFPVRDRIMTGVPLYDDNGGLVQAHGGGLVRDEKTGRYYWYGEARGASEVPERLRRYADWGWRVGVACYSSADLYNWKYEGLALEMLEDSDEAPLEYPASDIRVGEVLERPKVIYNEKTGKYVMWMHIDNGWYGYSRAGVAVADSPAGPFTYLGSFRPGDKMSRDMTVFKDDDGAAYIYFSTDENASLAVCRLSDDYLSCEGEAAYCISGGWREAPAPFKYKDTYYMITSGCTGWDPNAADYATAPSPLGPWTRHGSPMHGEGADLTFGGQSAYVLPVDAENGKFVFIADIWRPSHHDESGFIWLPIQINDNGIRIDWLDEWTLDDLGVAIDEPDTVFTKYGEIIGLPNTVEAFGGGEAVASASAVWADAAEALLPGHYRISGRAVGWTGGPFADTDIAVEVYNLPEKLLYFADCGAESDAEYTAVSSGGALFNSVPDQSYGPDAKTGRSWGYINDNRSGSRASADMFESVRYDLGGSVGEGLRYKFEVDPEGSYDVFVGVYDPWNEKGRKTDIAVQGLTAANALVAASDRRVISRSGVVAPDGTITVSAVRDEHALAGNLDPLVSWIMIAEAGGVSVKSAPRGLSYPQEDEAAAEEPDSPEPQPLYAVTAPDGTALGYDAEKPMTEALTTGEFKAEPSQLWTFTYTVSGAYIIESSAEYPSGESTEKRALDVLNHKADPSTPIIAYRTAGGENQRWFLEKLPSGAYHLRSELSGLYLTERNGLLTQEELGAEGVQTWTIEIR